MSTEVLNVKSDEHCDQPETKEENLDNTHCDVGKQSGEEIEFTIVFNKERLKVKFLNSETIGILKDHIKSLTNVPANMQKLVYKGKLSDAQTLKECGIGNGAKIMVVGSTPNDVLSINSTTPADFKDEKTTSITKEPLCRQKIHRKVLDKGIPPDAMPAWKNGRAPLPPDPLYGMVNKSGGKVRLTFKLETDQLWLGTKERTEKIGMNSIRAVISEPIEGHEEYHLMALQLGPTEASRYWIYWVPAQYIEAIKETILGP